MNLYTVVLVQLCLAQTWYWACNKVGRLHLLQLHAGSLAWQIGNVTRGDNRQEIFIETYIISEDCDGARFYFQRAWALRRGQILWTGVLEISLKITNLCSLPWYAGYAWLKSNGLSKQVCPVKVEISRLLNPKPKLTCWGATQSVIFPSSLANFNFFCVHLVFNFAEILVVL